MARPTMTRSDNTATGQTTSDEEKAEMAEKRDDRGSKSAGKAGKAILNASPWGAVLNAVTGVADNALRKPDHNTTINEAPPPAAPTVFGYPPEYALGAVVVAAVGYKVMKK